MSSKNKTTYFLVGLAILFFAFGLFSLSQPTKAPLPLDLPTTSTNSHSPQGVVSHYLQAIVGQHYTTAYGLLSLKSPLPSLPVYKQWEIYEREKYGPLLSYHIVATQTIGSKSTVSVLEYRGHAHPLKSTFTLLPTNSFYIFHSNDWRVVFVELPS